MILEDAKYIKQDTDASAPIDMDVKSMITATAKIPCISKIGDEFSVSFHSHI